MTYGVLGLGSIGSRHATNLRALGQQVIGFDPSIERMEWARAHGIAAASRNEVLECSEAVAICSPNAFHLQDLADSISAGLHVLVEKPLSHTTEGVESILKEAEAKGLQVFAAFNLRFHPAVLKATQLLQEGKIGSPLWGIFQSSHYLPSWRPDQDYRVGYAADPRTGGVLFDIIHEFDLANHLLGPAKTLASAARNTGTIRLPAEDCADVILGHASGVHSSLHLDYVSRPTRRLFEIGGTEGNLHVDLIAREVVLTDCEGERLKRLVFDSSTSADDYVNEMAAFVDCVQQMSAPACDGHAALSVLRQVVAARDMSGLPSS